MSKKNRQKRYFKMDSKKSSGGSIISDVELLTVNRDHAWFLRHPSAKEMVRDFVPGEAIYSVYKPSHMIVLCAMPGVYHRFQAVLMAESIQFLNTTASPLLYHDANAQSYLAQDMRMYSELKRRSMVAPGQVLSNFTEMSEQPVNMEQISFGGGKPSEEALEFRESRRIKNSSDSL